MKIHLFNIIYFKVPGCVFSTKCFECTGFINKLEKKYPGRKYYPYPSPNKNKKNKETHLLIRLEKKYPENWSYGSKEVQGG